MQYLSKMFTIKRMLDLAVILACVCSTLSSPYQDDVFQWKDFKLAHGKMYTSEEEAYRYTIFFENLRKIKEHNALYNAGLTSYKMGINQFTDMSQEEYEAYLTLLNSNLLLQSTRSTEIFDDSNVDDLPESIDYRELNAVNPVKNQRSCGSCWAFSTIGTIESHYFLKTGKLLSLSEQNLVDCSGTYGNGGCNGGWMQYAYKYIRDHGIETEKQYPYKAYEQACRFNKKRSVLRINGYIDVKRGNESALEAAVATAGPIAVSVDATGWSSYASGIYAVQEPRQGWRRNHAVIVVGYGSEDGYDYWTVRNSWGPRWGEEGYIRVGRNMGNQVGITDTPCYPDL